MSAEDEENFRKIERLSKSVEQHMKQIAKMKENSKQRVEDILNMKQDQDEIQEDLQAFAAAYSSNKNAINPFTQNSQIFQLDKKLIQLQNQSQEQKMNAILEKIRAKNK